MAAVDLPEGNPRIRLPFGFAKRHKVLLQAGVAGQWQLLISPDTQPAALLEIRRLLNQPFSISRMSAVNAASDGSENTKRRCPPNTAARSPRQNIFLCFGLVLE